jgi:glucose-6-phosphate 1-epimerase
MNFPDIAILNQRFGAPGRIAFRSGEADLPLVALVNKYAACEVSLYGGHVLSYRPVGHSPVLFVSQASLFEPGKPIRGGIPLCWPWFGPNPDKTLPLHGFARILQWDLHATEYSGDVTELRLALCDSDLTRRFWPFAFELNLRIWLDQRLNMELTSINRDTRPFTLTQAFHPYLRVRQIENVTVHGLDQAPFTDRLSGQTGRQDGPLSIATETDRLFTPAAPECVLHDTSLGRAIAITFTGTERCVVWNPWINKARAMADFGDDEYSRMLCVEPANTGDGAITLAPGERHTLSLALQATLT